MIGVVTPMCPFKITCLRYGYAYFVLLSNINLNLSNLYIKDTFIHIIYIYLHNVPNPEEIIRFKSEQQFVDHRKSKDTYEQF